MLVHKLKPHRSVKIGNTTIFNLGERAASIGIDSTEPVSYPSAKELIHLDKDRGGVISLLIHDAPEGHNE